MSAFPTVVTKFYPNSRVFHVNCVTPETWADVQVPTNTRRLVISGDYLDELIIPDGVESCDCVGLGLRRLVVPDSVEYLHCNRNNLRSLELPHGLYACDISNNPLYDLRFRSASGEDDTLRLGIIRLNRVKMTCFNAKVKENCEIDLDGNPQLVSFSPEVEYAMYTYPYKTSEYEDEFTTHMRQ